MAQGAAFRPTAISCPTVAAAAAAASTSEEALFTAAGARPGNCISACILKNNDGGLSSVAYRLDICAEAVGTKAMYVENCVPDITETE